MPAEENVNTKLTNNPGLFKGLECAKGLAGVICGHLGSVNIQAHFSNLLLPLILSLKFKMMKTNILMEQRSVCAFRNFEK